MALTPIRQELGNGITVLAQENHTTPAVSLVAALNSGAFADPETLEGTATLLSQMLDRGTRSRSGDAIADELDGRGASLAIAPGRHQMHVSATCLADDLSPLLAIVADVLTEPVFPADDLEARRSEVLAGILEEEDDPACVAVNTLMTELYAGHPYARRVHGTADSVGRITRDDLVRMHTGVLDHAGMTIVVVGSLPVAAMLDAVSRVFSGGATRTHTARPVVTDPLSAHQRRVLTRAMPAKSQCDVAYGFVGLRRADPDYIAASVMNNVLGQYALGGRLGDSIRERQGMAYYVFSNLDAGFGPGPAMVRAGVAPANVERTIQSIDTELGAVRGEGFTEQEVAESKQYMVGALPRQLETNAGIASFLLTSEVHGLGLDHDRRLPDLIRGVTRDAAVAAAVRLLDPARATIAVAGPEQ
ncbi:MAG: insulinase family protein [Acidobacteria bacterium]|nr:insulinase family protein [Acidobacteriota bacterium]